MNNTSQFPIINVVPATSLSSAPDANPTVTVVQGEAEIPLGDVAAQLVAGRIFAILESSVPDASDLGRISLTEEGLHAELAGALPIGPAEENLHSEAMQIVRSQMDLTPLPGKRSTLQKIYDYFEKRLAPKRFRARQRRYADSLVAASQTRVRHRAQIHVDPVDSKRKISVDVPEGLLMTDAEKQVVLQEKDQGAEAAVASKHYKNIEGSVGTLVSGGIAVRGYRINQKDEEIQAGRVIPTSFRSATAKKEKADRLTNCYMARHDGHGLIRTGVIDSKTKAAEFALAARKLNRDMGRRAGRPLRIVSQQLNSPETESKLITGQHAELARMDRNHDDLEIAHINTPCNRFYDYAEALEDIGITGVLKGEEKSRVQNQEGMCLYLKWLVEDMKSMAEDPSIPNGDRVALQQALDRMIDPRTKEILPSLIKKRHEVRDTAIELHDKSGELKSKTGGLKQKKQEMAKIEGEMTQRAAHYEKYDDLTAHRERLKKEIRTLESRIAALQKEVPEIKKTLSKQRKELKQELQARYDSLPSLEKSIQTSTDSKIIELNRTIALYRTLLGNQLRPVNLPASGRLARGQELMMFQYLNRRLGIVSAVNCKSGLDRTGFGFAMMMGQLQIPEERLYDLVTHWAAYSILLNANMQKLNYDMKQLDAWINDQPDKEMYRAVLEMRLNILNNLINIGLPTTFVSTGWIGLKWHKGYQENLIPLNFIPPVIQVVDKDGKAKPVQIITYNKLGKPEGLTEMGHRLLTQVSPQRVS